MHRSLALVTLFIIALAGPLAARGAPSRGPGLAPKYESLGWHREPAFAVGIGGAAWDGARNEGIAYGANDATITWRWNGSQWAPVAAAAGTLSLDPQLVYDAARRVIVQRSRLSDETWLWDGNVWTQVKPAHSPGVRRSLAMAYDEARQRVVMLGSGDNETWLWDGSDWSKAAAPGARPGPYDVPRLAYDAARQRVVLHGAANAFSPIETWLWNGTQWAKANPSTSPDDRYNGPLAYDAARQRVVLPTVGADLEFATWLWDGTNWTKANPVHHPSSRNAAALFYDSAQSRLLLVGGYGTVDSQTLSDTWAWDGSDWTLRLDDLHPSPTTGAAFAYDEVRGDALLYGGTPGATSIAETWRLVGSSWTKLVPATTPPAGATTKMFYDAARREIVLAVADASTLQTWRWNGTAWARATPPSSPPWRLDFALAYDAKRAVGVLFGGVTSTAVLDDTWTWNGTTWTSMSSVLRPPARRSAAMAFDAPREEMLLFGGLVLGGRLSTDDTWRWDGSQWTEARVDVAPPPRYDASMVHHALRGETLLFGGASDAVSYNDTWRWNGTTWQKATFNATPTERQDASMIYDPQRRRVVMFGGTYDASVWTLDYLGGGCVADADCPGTFCTDGVCCRVRECGSCETCNGLTPGTCSAVLNREDSDTCAVRNGKSCDDVGTCRGALGIAATAAETCASAIVADGVCCDTACNGPCASCLAETKEGHERSGTCGNRDPALCACAASSDCAQFHHCEQGRCAADRGATCENDHTLVDPAGARSDCGLYRCVGSTCLLACKSRSDCNANSDCTGDGRCVAFAETAADAGCNLHASRRGPLPRTAGAYVVLFWGAFSWLRRRRSARPKRRSAFVRTVLVALPLMVLASAVPRARDAAAQRGPAITAPRYDAVAWHRDATFSMSYGAAAWDSARGEAIAYGGIDNHLTWRWDGAHWTAIEAAPTPPRSSVHMVYDAARRVMVLRSDNRDDTWLWDGAAWLQVRPAHSPGAVPTSALVYDGARQRVLLAGSAEFWLWDGTDWAQAQPPTRPPARVLQLMAYDAARQRVVLFGGATLLPVNDTWLWDGTTWTQATSPTQPEAHIYGTLTYDAARQRVVLFGGNDDNRAETSTTWLWDGSAWTRANPATRPPPRTHASSFYDTTRSRVTFVGGRRNAVRGFGELSDSWTWDGSAWALREANMHPTARAWNGFAYDEARGTALMFGGTNADVTSNDTWRFDGDHWTEIALAVNPPIADDPRAGGLVYDAARSEVLLLLQVAGAMQTWRWNGATWTRTLPSTSPTARISFGLAYDAKHGEAVLFGGGQSSSLADTWTWNGTTWAPRTPAQSPRARSQHSMAYDALREEIVLFGGLPDDGSTELLGDTWRWNGSTWSEAKAVLSPPARRAAQMAFHGARGEVVLFGGHTEQQVLDDTWRWNGVAWSEAVPSESPLARSYGSLIYMPQRKRIVLFGGINDLGTTTNDDSTWQMAFLGAGCTSDTECPGASCNDGVCCRVKACGSCETCNGLTPGACSAVLNREDADTCALHDGKSCSDVGTCLAADGRAATAPTECASGSLADGVCCDSKCNGPCQSCVAESKEAHGGTGTCGNRVPSTCMCASNDDCAKFHHCEGGVCAIDRGAVCADDRTVVDPAGVRTDCGLYRCKGSECLPACKSREDCINDADCTSDGRCVAFGTSSGEKGGCNVHASGGMGCLGASLGFAAPIAACLARRGRRRIVRRPLQRPRGTRGRRASSASTAP